jgi:hypothetical protein
MAVMAMVAMMTTSEQQLRVTLAADAPAGTAVLVEAMVSAPPPGATPAEWKWALEGFSKTRKERGRAYAAEQRHVSTALKRLKDGP